MFIRVAHFTLIARHLYQMGADEILRRNVPKHERHSIVVEAHGGVVGGHYPVKATTQKILHARLLWPTVHKGSNEYCNTCDVFHRTRRSSRRDEIALHP